MISIPLLFSVINLPLFLISFLLVTRLFSLTLSFLICVCVCINDLMRVTYMSMGEEVIYRTKETCQRLQY